jgi:UDP-N-acetylmuramoyl-L-alanyl-D-glutamate--2,6-diaminopimelate ligase
VAVRPDSPPGMRRSRLYTAPLPVTLRDLMGAEAPDVPISSLAYASDQVAPGALFFCVPGFRADGHDFAPDAVARGAVALVCERSLDLGVPEVVVPDARAAMGPAAARFFGDPTAELRVVGVTGTNGKTTTAFLVRAVLEAAGTPCGLLGTVTSVIGGREEPVERTTPEAIDLQRSFRRMLDAGDRACAIEVSSHALELGRANGIRFATRVFTNLSQDHLDFHPSMEHYFLAKRRLFELHGGEPGTSVVNADDEWGRRLIAELDDIVTYGVDQPAVIRARDVEFDPDGSRFTCDTPDGSIELTTRLPGHFNVLNALAALGAVRALGVDLEVAARALAAADRVPGRMEPVDEGQGFAVLVDYAHTPEALENVLRAARELCRGRLHVVFGAGGDRDKTKRPLMGRVAAALADRVVVTSDNPRSEDPEAIVDEVMIGTGPDAEREVDRRAGIARALAGAAPEDVVVIAGKGHEQGQEFAGGRKEPFDDVSEARAALRPLLAAEVERGPGGAGAKATGGAAPATAGIAAPAGRAAPPPTARTPRSTAPPSGWPRRRVARSWPAIRTPRGRAAPSRTRARSGPATCSSACPAPAPTAGLSRATRSPPVGGESLYVPSTRPASHPATWSSSLPTIRSPRSGASPVPGGASSPPRRSGSPARPARPRPRTSSPRSCARTATRTRAARTSTPRSACLSRSSRRGRGRRPSCSRWRCAARARSPSSRRSPSRTWG